MNSKPDPPCNREIESSQNQSLKPPAINVNEQHSETQTLAKSGKLLPEPHQIPSFYEALYCWTHSRM